MLFLYQLFVQSDCPEFDIGTQFPSVAEGDCSFGKQKPSKKTYQHFLTDSVMDHEIAYITVWTHLQALLCKLLF